MGKMFSLWLLDVDKSAPPSATSSDDDTNEKEAASAAASGELALNMSSDAVDSTATSPSPNISTVVVPALSNAEDAPEEKNEVVTNPLSIPMVVGTPLAGSATSSSSTSNEDSFTMIDQADADTEEVHLVVEPEAPPAVTPSHQAAPASACAQEQPQEYPKALQDEEDVLTSFGISADFRAAVLDKFGNDLNMAAIQLQAMRERHLEMAAIGFRDEATNMRLLLKHDNSMERALDDLLVEEEE